jgi:hypothetical protein
VSSSVHSYLISDIKSTGAERRKVKRFLPATRLSFHHFPKQNFGLSLSLSWKNKKLPWHELSASGPSLLSNPTIPVLFGLICIRRSEAFISSSESEEDEEVISFVSILQTPVAYDSDLSQPLRLNEPLSAVSVIGKQMCVLYLGWWFELLVSGQGCSKPGRRQTTFRLHTIRSSQTRWQNTTNPKLPILNRRYLQSRCVVARKKGLLSIFYFGEICTP